MLYNNAEIEGMLQSLPEYLERKDVIGYAAARNARILQTELTEFEQKRDALIMEYGEQDTDEQGNYVGYRVNPESDTFANFVEALNELAQIELDVDIFKIPYEEAIGKLSGIELLKIDWMFEDR